MEAPPLHLSDFFGPSGAALADAPGFPPHLRHCLLSGPERCGKTALLLAYAHSLARRGIPVLLICWR